MPRTRKKWTPNKVMEEIKKLKDKSASWNHKNNSSLYNAAVTHFGSWKAAVRACGFDYYEIKKVSNKKWSDTDMDFLKKNFQNLSTEDIAKILGRSRNSINTYRHRWGLKLNLDRFTDEEQEFIKKNYKRLSDKEIAQKLGESSNAVYYFRLKEGLKKSDRWDEEKVLEDIRALHDSGSLKNISASEPLYAAARRCYGSWKKAIEKAGYEYGKVIKKGRRKLVK
ncbi:MAG: sigma-70 region 4 domain-containing protein [Oligoflexia bacterium]|nr:sigma-70 region 4 domain-containing protein [Oligoflexia bacterium]